MIIESIEHNHIRLELIEDSGIYRVKLCGYTKYKSRRLMTAINNYSRLAMSLWKREE